MIENQVSCFFETHCTYVLLALYLQQRGLRVNAVRTAWQSQTNGTGIAPPTIYSGVPRGRARGRPKTYDTNF